MVGLLGLVEGGAGAGAGAEVAVEGLGFLSFLGFFLEGLDGLARELGEEA